MATINAIAHLNELTKDEKNDYYLTPQVTGTLTVSDIIERIRKREIATKNVDGTAFVQTFLDECAAATAEGYNIVNSFFRSSISIQGVVYSDDLGHNIPADRLKVSVNLTQGDGAKEAIESTKIYAFEQAGAIGPIIQTVSDPTEGIAGHLNPGSMVLIQGMRLSVKGDDPSVGVLFTSVDNPDTTVFVAPSKLSPNTPTKLQFVLPAGVTEGKWYVTVTTQYTSGTSSLLKSPRSYQFADPITVGVVSDEDDDRPEEL